jgi:hypothetical protein
MKHCAFPGCGAKLARHNIGGLCKDHNHTRGICRCDKCRKLGPVRKKPEDRTARPDVREVIVVAAPAFSSSNDQKAARISLKREPWLSIGDLAANLVEKAARK